MAKLPDITARRPVGRSGRAISSDRSGSIVGEAISGFGSAIGDVADAMQERENKFAYARAKSALYREDARIRAELAQDADWTTYEERYRDLFSKAIESASEHIEASSDQELFNQDAMMDLERGAADVIALARQKEIDQGRADLAEALAENRRVALESDEATRHSVITNTYDLIRSAQETGYIDAVESQSFREQWTTDFARGVVEMLPPGTRIEMLRNPSGTPADFLQPDERAQLLDAARDEDRALLVRAHSQTEADRIMGEYDSEREALAHARRTLKDPEVRDATVTRVKQRFAEQRATKAQRNTEAFEAASAIVEQTGSVDGIEADVRVNVLTPAQNNALDARAAQVAAGIQPHTDQALWYDLMQQSVNDPESFRREDLLLYKHQLSDPDFQNLARLQAAVAGDASEDALKAYDGVQTELQVVQTVMEEHGLDPNPKAGSDMADRVAKFWKALNGEVWALQRRQGRDATEEEIQEIADRLTIEGTQPRSWWFDRDVMLFEADTDQEFTVTVPDDARRRILKFLRDNNLRTDDDAVRAVYEAELAQ